MLQINGEKYVGSIGAKAALGAESCRPTDVLRGTLAVRLDVDFASRRTSSLDVGTRALRVSNL